jgi:hypothetical protein
MDWQRRRTLIVPLTLPLLAGAVACSEHRSSEFETSAAALDSSRLYGTYCQQDFQNDWRPLLSDTWTMCANFNSAMNDLSPQSFYWSMHGVASLWEDSEDQADDGGLDTVDLVFISTHGGAWTNPDVATQTMWDQDTRTLSTDWRLGDESRGLSLYATHSCETLMRDEHILDRWTSVFDGGLRMVVGSHGDLYTDTGDGQRFANNMKSGQLIKDAWANALHGGSPDQDAAVLTTGSDENNCWARMNSINWSNLTSTNTPRLQDNAWQYWCHIQWDNL